MLEAKKSRWFEKIFAVYNKNLLKHRFAALYVSGLDYFQDSQTRSIPLVIYANHSSWWDGLIAFEISRRARLNSYVMMEEKHLKKLFLFRRLGAFSVVREKPRQASESINYAVSLLKEKPKTALWIFPQGEILPNELRPLKFYNGAAKIIQKSGGVFAVPLAIRGEFRGDFKPEIFVRIGEPELISTDKKVKTKNLTANFETTLTEVLDNLKIDVLTDNLQNYENILT